MKKTFFPLLVILMMMPQISETLYSPALIGISRTFHISAAVAGQTVSVYFFGFAVGVVFFGIACDRFGRRKTMLAGLTVYVLGAVVALLAKDFSVFLLARIVSAFGAAVASVATQTIMRDVYRGEKLARAFAVMGLALSFSPLLGLYAGHASFQWGGVNMVFIVQIGMAATLLTACCFILQETRTKANQSHALWPVLQVMLRDWAIWRSAILIAAFNIMLYGFYLLAPFYFARLALGDHIYGAVGLCLAAGGIMGAWLNHAMVKASVAHAVQLLVAIGFAMVSAGLFSGGTNVWPVLLSCFFLSFAYGVAIPALLAAALTSYRQHYGVAAAVLGLFYYMVIACGLAIAGREQQLAGTVFICAFIALILTLQLRKTKLTARDSACPNDHAE
ncbi:MFS transporter [Bartonella sp. LJL80]